MMTPQPCACGQPQPAQLRQSFMWLGGGWSWTQVKQLWNAPERSLWGQKLNCSYWTWKFEPFDSWSDFRSTTWMNRGCSCLNVLELLDIGPCISWFLMYLSMWFLMLAHWNRHISTARSTSHGALDTTLRPSYWDLGGLQLALRFWAFFWMFLNGTST